ncbi:hypothetical protein O3P69_019052 [Scylla paramamosain]|uniref:Uncharacterized protein n=1 Tax=Scylla paramamosain TaxID=85552 RepID=A0AAW0T7I4_SCYPA
MGAVNDAAFKAHRRVVVGIIPRIRWQGGAYSRNTGINDSLKYLCRKEDVTFVDPYEEFFDSPDLFKKDGVHVNEEGKARLLTLVKRGCREAGLGSGKYKKKQQHGLQQKNGLIEGERQLYQEIRGLLQDRVCILVGDFNSNVDWETRESSFAGTPLLEFVNENFLIQRIRGQLIEVLKILRGFDNVDFRCLFQLSEGRTRNNGYKLELKRYNRDHCGTFFSYKICSRWDALPSDVVNNDSVEKIKTRLDKVLPRL